MLELTFAPPLAMTFEYLVSQEQSFQHWRLPWQAKCKLTMPPKRGAPVETKQRPQTGEGPSAILVAHTPIPPKRKSIQKKLHWPTSAAEANQPNPRPTPEQVLQQVQADLQNAQQERDRLAATTTRNIHLYDENANDESEIIIEDSFYDEYFCFIIDQW